ncbi:hypothetical protein [Actinomadura macra]|uniref:hypothetical protein n=1 Tax=Actinomadura macra TaxID=46164 RepID=UPI000836D047|nr:hypothetical protein [Actinomadura macra]
MAKSQRQHKNSSRPFGRSGDPRKRAQGWPGNAVERAFTRISGAAGPDGVCRPEAIPLLLLYVLELQAAKDDDVLDDCIASCETLRLAYGLLGIQAETRAVDLAVMSRSRGTAEHYGTSEPSWTGPTHDGHCVLWLPGVKMFMDPTVERFPHLAKPGLGPVSGRSVVLTGETEETEAGILPAGTGLEVLRADHLLRYTFAPAEATRVLIGHPRVQALAGGLRRASANLAGLSLQTLRIIESWDLAREGTPHPRVRAYLEVLGDSEVLRDEPDVRFLVRGLGGTVRRLRLDEVPC